MAGRAVLAELLLPYSPGSKQMPFTALEGSDYCFLSAYSCSGSPLQWWQKGVRKGSSSSCCVKSRPWRGHWSAMFCPAVPPHYWVTGDTALETTASWHCRQGFCFNTCLQSVALCLPSLFSPLGPKLKDSYEKMKVWASPCPLNFSQPWGSGPGKRRCMLKDFTELQPEPWLLAEAVSTAVHGTGQGRKKELQTSWSLSGKRFTRTQTVCLLSTQLYDLFIAS